MALQFMFDVLGHNAQQPGDRNSPLLLLDEMFSTKTTCRIAERGTRKPANA